MYSLCLSVLVEFVHCIDLFREIALCFVDFLCGFSVSNFIDFCFYVCYFFPVAFSQMERSSLLMDVFSVLDFSLSPALTVSHKF
jgi:hypothetical protein